MNMSSDDVLLRAYQRCRDITRTRARNFYYGIRLSPEPQRSAIYALYAWMRLADDLVDGTDGRDVASLADRITAFTLATDRALAGQLPYALPNAVASANADIAWHAIADTIQRFHLSPIHFHDMLDGQRADARCERYDTFAQLQRYCRQVASTVGLLCLEIWGSDDPRAAEHASNRGVAFQLTNILRDVAEDHDAGRTYLPLEDFDRFDLTPSELRHWSKPDACNNMIMCTLERARKYYAMSAPLDDMVGESGRATLWAMTAIYQRLLDAIARAPARVVHGPRIRLSALQKGTIALRAKLLARRQLRHNKRESAANVST